MPKSKADKEAFSKDDYKAISKPVAKKKPVKRPFGAKPKSSVNKSQRKQLDSLEDE